MKNKMILSIILVSLASNILFAPMLFAQMSKSQLITEMLERGDDRFAGNEILKSVQSEHNFIAQLQKQKELHEILQQKLNAAIEPHVRMYAHEQEMRKLEARGFSREDIYKAFQPAQGLSKSMASGSISGTVMVAGNPPLWGSVLAYDEFGYLAAQTNTINFQTGGYQIDGLPAGNYYVRTNCDGIDEFYDDIPTDFSLVNWRRVVDEGHLVTVTEGQTTTDINFALDIGSMIKGMVYEADGTTPIRITSFDWPYPEFIFYNANTGTRIWYSRSMHSSTGEYYLIFEYMGDGKLSLSIPGYDTQFFNQKTDMAGADIITFESYADTVYNVDFLMQPGEPDPSARNAAWGNIEGKVTVAGGLPPFFALVALFNADDTSFVNWVTTSVLELGEYSFNWITPGNYLLYADDFMGNAFPGVNNYIGEYYQDAYLPQNATVVTVADDDTVRNIDFTLEAGGTISGTVTEPSGNPVDSTLVVALESDIFHMIIELPLGALLFENIKNADVAIGRTDADGNYLLDGLPEGSYKVRTFSYYTPADRQHVDEYYPGVKNILHYDDATDVMVSAAAKASADNIDFVLDPAGTIKGTIFDEDGVTPVENVLVFAAVDSNGLPAVAPPDTTGEDGKYTLVGLAEDKWKVMAVPLESDIYVPEWYESVRGIDDATALDVTSGGTVAGIDFTLNAGGFIQGIVYLDDDFRAGNDTLWNFPIIVYESETGAFAGLEPVTQMGGYRIGQLKPGNYKVCALPAIDGYGVSYHGGGISFDDTKSVDVVVTKNDSVRADIDMIQAAGIIGGTVYGVDCQTPLASIMLATDNTGHAVSFCLSGVDRTTGEQLDTRGDYVLYGLHAGEWYVRTNAMMGIVDFLFDMNGARIAKTMNCPRPHYSDEYSNNRQINPNDDHDCYNYKYTRNMDSGEDDETTTSKLGYANYYQINKDLYRWSSNLVPGASRIPVMMVTKGMAKSAQTATTGVDFCLSEYGETDVTTLDSRKPESFALYQNYPNPFNPETHIQYQLPQKTDVTLAIYNTSGQKVVTLVSQAQTAGVYHVTWNGLDANKCQVPSGLYIYKLTAGNHIESKKLLLVR